MKRYPLAEMKDLLNEVLRANKMHEIVATRIGNYTQFQILKYLLEHEDKEVFQKDFEDVLNIRKSTISGILDTMEKNKIIKRHSSKLDGRGKVVSISDECQGCKRKMFATAMKSEEKIVEGISEEELDNFYKVIDKMRSNMKKDGVKND